jgi:putative FmdB family regulatory protein
MPLFDYYCYACEHVWEVLEPPEHPERCPKCKNSAIEKQLGIVHTQMDGNFDTTPVAKKIQVKNDQLRKKWED